MSWLQHSSKHPASAQPTEKSDNSRGELRAFSHQHSTEVVLLEMTPYTFDVVELLGRVGRKPEDANELLDALDLGKASLGGMSRTIVDYQHDPSARLPGPLFHHLEHPYEQGRVDTLEPVREQKRAVRPPHRSTHGHADVFAGGGNPKRFSSLAIGVDRDGKQVEPYSVGEPEFVISPRPQSPFFNRPRDFRARFVASRFCRFRIVRLVLRQTIPCWRNNSDTQADVNQIPVVSPRYWANRGAVHRVKAYPNSRGSRGISRSIVLTYRGVALGGRPDRSASSNPKIRCVSQRRFQRSRVVRVIESESRILSVETPAANRRIAVIRSLARLDFALRRCLFRNFRWDRVRRTISGDGMECSPSLVFRGVVYHVVLLSSPFMMQNLTEVA